MSYRWKSCVWPVHPPKLITNYFFDVDVLASDFKNIIKMRFYRQTYLTSDGTEKQQKMLEKKKILVTLENMGTRSQFKNNGFMVEAGQSGRDAWGQMHNVE